MLFSFVEQEKYERIFCSDSLQIWYIFVYIKGLKKKPPKKEKNITKMLQME